MIDVQGWEPGNYLIILTVNGQRQPCEGIARVSVNVAGVKSIEIDAYVVDFQPLGFDFILGMNGIEGFGEVTIKSAGLVRFGGQEVQDKVSYGAGAVKNDAITVVQPDFEVSFDPDSRVWTTKWKWVNEFEPENLKNRLAMYPMSDAVREPFEKEILRWIDEGWLKRYDEKRQGPAKGLVPLLAVVQASKHAA